MVADTPVRMVADTPVRMVADATARMVPGKAAGWSRRAHGSGPEPGPRDLRPPFHADARTLPGVTGSGSDACPSPLAGAERGGAQGSTESTEGTAASACVGSERPPGVSRTGSALPLSYAPYGTAGIEPATSRLAVDNRYPGARRRPSLLSSFVRRRRRGAPSVTCPAVPPCMSRPLTARRTTRGSPDYCTVQWLSTVLRRKGGESITLGEQGMRLVLLDAILVNSLPCRWRPAARTCENLVLRRGLNTSRPALGRGV